MINHNKSFLAQTHRKISLNVIHGSIDKTSIKQSVFDVNITYTILTLLYIIMVVDTRR